MIISLLLIFGIVTGYISIMAAGGGSLLLVPVVSFLVGPHLVAPILTTGNAIASPFGLYFFWPYINWKVALWLLPGIIPGAILGAYVYTQMHPLLIEFLVGLFLLSTIFQYGFGHKEKSFVMRIPYFPILGFVTTLFSSIIGAVGPVQNPFFLNYGLNKESLVATRGVSSLMMHSTKLVAYFHFGALNPELIIFGVAIGLGITSGMFIAKHYLQIISTQRFKNYTLSIMFFSGLILIFRVGAQLLETVSEYL
ncbi:sulfite exporter TauE/SafE family protein [Microbulbifer echini]|uniref:Probable membrane transporter protein n=1 Tax=Microbulbifer echini TaxID=1529067 RepID=A0ABV4NQH0_9GAMM|nr:sulfite exporter TauE/SafE family protein [uncultured Microbulbifer sp.]